MTKLILTDKGKELILSSLQEDSKFTFTRIKSTSKSYTKEEIPNLLELQEIKQESIISSIDKIDNNSVQVTAHINNSNPELSEGYHINTIGLYAKKDNTDNEILYGVSIEDKEPDYINKFSEGVCGITYRFNTTVTDSEKINTNISMGAIPSQEEMDKLKEVVIRSNDDISKHLKYNITGNEGVHGLRYDEENKKLQYKKDDEWKDMINTGNGGGINGTGNSVLKIHFAEDFKGLEYIVTDNNTDTKTGIVSDSLVEVVALNNVNTTYMVKCTYGIVEYVVNVCTNMYYGEYITSITTFSATIQVKTVPNTEVIARVDHLIYSGISDNYGNLTMKVGTPGWYKVYATREGCESNVYKFYVKDEAGKTYNVKNSFCTLTLESPVNCKITLSHAENGTVITRKSTGNDFFYLNEFGRWNIRLEDAEIPEPREDYIIVGSYINYDMTMTLMRVYGAYWDGNPPTKLVRTHESQNFRDPKPLTFYGGESWTGGFSDFDNLFPWSHMKIVERSCGMCVQIPRFWYTMDNDNTGLRLCISSTKQDGFMVSPAHMDRGDGFGERKYVYISRFPIDKTYRSTNKPTTGMYLDTLENHMKKIHEIYADNVIVLDIFTLTTIWILYLVEYADFNYRNVINNNKYSTNISKFIPGSSINYRTYHTSMDARLTMISQYRNIEGIAEIPSAISCIERGQARTKQLRIYKNPHDFREKIYKNSTIIENVPYSNLYHGIAYRYIINTINGIKLFFPSHYVNNNNYNEYNAGIIEYAGNIFVSCHNTTSVQSWNFITSRSILLNERVACRVVELPR